MTDNSSEETPPVQLAMIDGRDALLMVLVKPSERDDDNVMVDAHCNGLDKMQAASLLYQVARMWKAEAEQQAAAVPTDPALDTGCEGCE